MNIDLSHLIGDDYETMDGRPARVVYVANETASQLPVLVVIDGPLNIQHSVWLTLDLRLSSREVAAYILRKPKRETREYFMNIDKNGTPWLFFDREKADRYAYQDRIACVRVEVSFQHGEGL